MIVTCNFCGKRFKKRNGRAKKDERHFCDLACFGKSRRNKIKKVCKYCGDEFLSRPEGKRPSIFCSQTCGQKVEDHIRWAIKFLNDYGYAVYKNPPKGAKSS